MFKRRIRDRDKTERLADTRRYGFNKVDKQTLRPSDMPMHCGL